jgi:hypothetical protein
VIAGAVDLSLTSASSVDHPALRFQGDLIRPGARDRFQSGEIITICTDRVLCRSCRADQQYRSACWKVPISLSSRGPVGHQSPRMAHSHVALCVFLLFLAAPLCQAGLLDRVAQFWQGLTHRPSPPNTSTTGDHLRQSRCSCAVWDQQ